MPPNREQRERLKDWLDFAEKLGDGLPYVCHRLSILHAMSALYEGCWHKLHRAKYHLDELQDHVGSWIHSHPEPPFRFGKEFDAKRNRFIFRVESVRELPIEWSLIAGDALTNFRAALDYLAHELVGAGREPHWKGGVKPQFAIGRTRSVFRDKVRQRMPGILPKHRTIIEGYQPYKWRAARDRHPFALLDTLVTSDKHRELQLITVYNLHKFRADVVSVHDFAISRMERGRVFGRRGKLVHRFEPGAEVARVFGKKTGPDPNVEMAFQGATSIAFQDAKAFFPDALTDIGQAITKLFSEIEPVL